MSILALPRRNQAETGPANLVLTGVTKTFGTGTRALEGVDMEVARGEFVCLVGASGSGKSTLLSLIAGLDRPSAGEVAVTGRVAIMFQESALFPWLTAIENVEMPMRLKGVPKKTRRAEAQRLLELVRLNGFSTHRPHELSGGMRQRVALARALAQECQILLMDEPFAALDAITRDMLHEDLSRVVQAAGLTVVFVTHNVREAVRLADRVLLLGSRPGRVLEEYAVDIERPRRIEDLDVASLAGEITDRLREEMRVVGIG